VADAGSIAGRRLARRPAGFFPAGRPEPAGVPERAPEDELDLGVEAAQVVGRPPLDGVEDVAVDPDQEGLSLGHDGDTYW
jgi:hypothetical protein